ncbi:calcium-binding protein [Hansschlegelia zhihuaiae]|uniref:Calcium-binding protein n=2 Tax=Hansschlegelia zhihuaiae TaxID=405005 RepID=A0A4Q0MKC4_9HYPH|nr:calcium-binding protein [Hansschlegelia zhihuaiae]
MRLAPRSAARAVDPFNRIRPRAATGLTPGRWPARLSRRETIAWPVGGGDSISVRIETTGASHGVVIGSTQVHGLTSAAASSIVAHCSCGPRRAVRETVGGRLTMGVWTGNRYIGDATDETIQGSDADEWITAGGGTDLVLAGGGYDSIHGDSADTVLGGAGDDSISGVGTVVAGAGNDVIYSGRTIEAGAGNDFIYGGVTVKAGAGDDDILSVGTAEGGAGNDSISGSGSDVWLKGDAGDDWLRGGGRDLLEGGKGRDTIEGNPSPGSGADTMLGGAGDDVLSKVSAGSIVDGGVGEGDLVVLGEFVDRNSTVAYSFGLVQGGSHIRANGVDFALVRGVEQVQIFGAAAGDSFVGGTLGDLLVGFAGDDTLRGGGGGDSLDGGVGVQSIDGGDGDDAVSFDLSAATEDLSLAVGDRDLGPYGLLRSVERFADVRLGSGDDTVVGGDGDDMVNAGGGADQVAGGDGDDILVHEIAEDETNDFLLNSFDGGEGIDTLGITIASYNGPLQVVVGETMLVRLGGAAIVSATSMEALKISVASAADNSVVGRRLCGRRRTGRRRRLCGPEGRRRPHRAGRRRRHRGGRRGR